MGHTHSGPTEFIPVMRLRALMYPRSLGRLGFTVLELLIVLAILSILSGVLLSTSLVSQKAYVSAEAYAHVQQEARQAFDAMTKELREAGGTISALGSQLDFQIVLGYDLAAPCPANALCVGARDANGVDQPGWWTRYRLVGTQLVREILDAANTVQPGTRVLANDVDALLFNYIGGSAKTIVIQLHVQQSSQQLPGGSTGTTPAPLLTSIQLRNP